MNLKSFLAFLNWLKYGNGGWHRAVPLLPHITEDRYLIWLWPAWRCYYGATDWEGGNWSYGWRFHKPEGQHG